LIRSNAADAAVSVPPQREGRPEALAPESWPACAQAHLEDVYRYVVQRVSSLDEAEEITAEVFAAAAVALPRHPSLAPLGWVPGGQCPLYLWLLSIARRQIALARRRRAVRRETLTSELADAQSEAAAIWDALVAIEGPEAAVMRAEARQVLRELIARLSADQREALLLQQMEELSVAEIAVVMGRSAASVKSLLQRARATLHRWGRAYFLGDDEEQDP
jgi:RNA polymerase sigma-70 factor (ECF subfamily)